MQTTNIECFLRNDNILNKINKQFISLNFDEVRHNNPYLIKIFEQLIEAMRRQSPLFDKTFQRIIWAGSYYKKTRVGEPEEYDINFVINLPFKERDIEFISDCPGFIEIRTPWRERNMSYNTLNLTKEAQKELNSFIDNESYLNQDKFRAWMEGILSRVAKETSKSDRIILLNGVPITRIKTGPAFTLKIQFEVSGKLIDIDVVPVLTFSTCNPPPRCSEMSILKDYLRGSRYWSAVPKPLNNSRTQFNDELYRYWRLCFYEIEKDILDRHGRAKPIIRLLKKLRDTQKWNIASYYIETLCLNELDIFLNSNKSDTSLFFTMIQKLREAFRQGRIRYFWDKDLNLLEQIKSSTMKCMFGSIDRIINKIEKTIADDKYAIAKVILNTSELNALISSIDQSSESEPEPVDQWSCMIV
ncbi:cyclic GMP-AMP synthase-like receptor isoform X1 [Anoplolepis gracilipes]|uniref:cyclic GMP-AMP synthase-like receptor isoform X1 n=1 Tax=Anoplolepis gracilipes TaxID=354296 RepID=UPI003BA00967